MALYLEITYGHHLVSDADRDRALAAATAALGSTDPVAASAEFDRQIDAALGATSALTGLAVVWERAQSAADRALTLGWRDTDGATCEVIAR